MINQWRLANVNRHMGRNDLQKQKDDLAINIMDAFITVVYYQGLVKMCSEKLEDSQRLLYKTRRQEELGLKGKADVAQIESQVAGDDYNLTHQQNLYNTAMMTLKNAMNYPSDLALDVDTVVPPYGIYWLRNLSVPFRIMLWQTIRLLYRLISIESQ